MLNTIIAGNFSDLLKIDAYIRTSKIPAPILRHVPVRYHIDLDAGNVKINKIVEADWKTAIVLNLYYWSLNLQPCLHHRLLQFFQFVTVYIQ